MQGDLENKGESGKESEALEPTSWPQCQLHLRATLHAPPATLSHLALVAWGGVLLVVCCRTCLAPQRHTVYPIFAQAGNNWRQSNDLYANQAHLGLDRYRYSPLFGAVMVPFSQLPDQVGGVLWRLLNAVVLIGGFAWWCRQVAWAKAALSPEQWAVLWLLLLPLAIGNFNNGQTNPLVLGCLLIAVASAASGRWSLAAAVLAAAVLVKLYLLAVGLLLSVLFPRQFGGRFLLALAIGLALPFLLQQPDYVLDQCASWLRCLSTDDRSSQPLFLSYRDIRLLFRLEQLPLGNGLYRLLQLATAGGVLLACLAGQRCCWPQARLLTMLTHLACCWMILFGPATESATYMLLAPTLVWTVYQAWQPGQALWTRPAAAAMFLLLAASPIACWFPGGRHWLPGLKPLVALLLTLHLLTVYLPWLLSGWFGVGRHPLAAEGK